VLTSSANASELALRDRLFENIIGASSSDFLTFVRFMAPLLIADFHMGRHIELICSKLQEVDDGVCKRLMVFLPPRSSKSVICSKLFPAWYMGRHPNHEILSVSHSDQLSSDFGRAVRDLVGNEMFQTIFPSVRLRSDVRSAGKWQTNHNGVYVAAGVKTQIAGRGAHVAILDDVMSEEDAFSEAGRRYIKEWFPAGLRTRLMPGGAIVIINTRYHEDDICGWLLETEGGSGDYGDEVVNPWEVIKIPAWLDEESAKLLNLPVGSSYFPEWKPDHVLQLDELEIKRHNGSKYWQSLYMQDPTPQDGGIIKKGWFKSWPHEDPPECQFVIQTMDTAFSAKTTADYSVMQTWGIFEKYETDSAGKERCVPHLILLGNIRERFEYPELRITAQTEYEKHKPDAIMIEKKASGQSLIQDLRRAGLPVLEFNPDRDKVSRATAATPFFESGRVWLPEYKDWALDLIDEAVSFPNARYDDQVDAMVMAVLYMRDSWHVSHEDDPNYDADEEDENIYKPGRKGYWNFTTESYVG
jgi:predicted phage terminase large subunit-like protein